jgi:hypothetical protein
MKMKTREEIEREINKLKVEIREYESFIYDNDPEYANLHYPVKTNLNIVAAAARSHMCALYGLLNAMN